MSGRSFWGRDDADSIMQTAVSGENAGAAILHMPFETMIALAPPATASLVRASMSASGSRKRGEVIPWSSAQMIETP